VLIGFRYAWTVPYSTTHKGRASMHGHSLGCGRIKPVVSTTRTLIETQDSLRRLARLVADGAPPDAIFAAANQEALHHLGASGARMIRYETDGTTTVLADLGTCDSHVHVGQTEVNHPPEGLTATIRRTGRPARVDDHQALTGGDPLCRDGVRAAVGVPIHVHGHLWGLIGVGSKSGDLPMDTEQQLADFTELIAIAVAHAQSRAELNASRARIVAASDEARRRIERDLHDGAQQRLVGLAMRLGAAADSVSAHEPVRDELCAMISEVDEISEGLREISRGIHPAILSSAGIPAALRMLARRSTVAVQTDIRVERRLPMAAEVCAYYVVSEALTNVTKHARASQAQVRVVMDGAILRICVSDNGLGGADPNRGTGLIGIDDRVQALGGALSVTSERGEGTTISCDLPTEKIGDHQPTLS
jgi:signal transduction histidine kinase